MLFLSADIHTFPSGFPLLLLAAGGNWFWFLLDQGCFDAHALQLMVRSHLSVGNENCQGKILNLRPFPEEKNSMFYQSFKQQRLPFCQPPEVAQYPFADR